MNWSDQPAKMQLYYKTVNTAVYVTSHNICIDKLYCHATMKQILPSICTFYKYSLPRNETYKSICIDPSLWDDSFIDNFHGGSGVIAKPPLKEWRGYFAIYDFHVKKILNHALNSTLVWLICVSKIGPWCYGFRQYQLWWQPYALYYVRPLNFI